MPEILRGPLCFGARSRFGGITDPGIFKGISSALTATADMKDTRSALGGNVELAITAPNVLCPGMLIAPSTTSGFGLLFVANAPVSGNSYGNAISVTIDSPSGSTTSITASGNAITIAPANGLTVGTLAQLVNANTHSAPLVTAYPWGWQANGIVDVSWQPNPLELVWADAVAALSQTSLAGGCAAGSAAQAGTISIYGSSDAVNVSSNPLATQAISGVGTTQIALTSFPRFLQVQWVPSSGSVGLLFGQWDGRAAS